MIDFGGLGAALRGMFRLRPNNAAHRALLNNLDELRCVSACVEPPRPLNELERTLRRITKAIRDD